MKPSVQLLGSVRRECRWPPCRTEHTWSTRPHGECCCAELSSSGARWRACRVLRDQQGPRRRSGASEGRQGGCAPRRRPGGQGRGCGRQGRSGAGGACGPKWWGSDLTENLRTDQIHRVGGQGGPGASERKEAVRGGPRWRSCLSASMGDWSAHRRDRHWSGRGAVSTGGEREHGRGQAP